MRTVYQIKHSKGSRPIRVMKGDRVRLKQFQLYKFEIMPDLPPEKWTGVVTDTWGIARSFAKVQRDHDGRTIPLMIDQIEFLKRPKPTRRKGRR